VDISIGLLSSLRINNCTRNLSSVLRRIRHVKFGFRRLDALKPGESLDFPFRAEFIETDAIAPGMLEVENPPEKCSELSKGKEVTSNVFLVRE
jgi:hypothetical protein